jgi:GTPase SAR1 family protein
MIETEILEQITKEIIAENEFIKLKGKDGKIYLYKRKGTLITRERNNTDLVKYCAEKIKKRFDCSDEKISLIKLTRELLFMLDISPGFIIDEVKFLPPRFTIPLKNGEYSFVTNTFNENDGKTLRLMRINSYYNERYKNERLPYYLETLIQNGISNPNFDSEENERRYNIFLDYIAYFFYPGNPLRRFFIIVGAPHSGKTTLCKIFRNVFDSYACSLDMHSLQKQSRPTPEARPDLYNIEDKLWIDIAELDKGKIQTRLVKNLSGNDPIITRQLHSNEMKEEALLGKFIIVCNNYPQFDDRDDEALKERLVVFDWHNSISDDKTIYNLADKLNSEDNRARIATFFINRLSRNIKDDKISIKNHHSFIFRPDCSYDKKEVDVNTFFDEALMCLGSEKWMINGSMPYYYPICRADIYGAYYNYVTYLEKPMNLRIKKREFKRYLDNYLDNYPLVEEYRLPNGSFYKGIIINTNLFNFPMTNPQYGNFGKPKRISCNQNTPMFC